MIQFEIPEFTCNCPLTGQPDFAQFTIEMIADELCIELKSLKLYMWSYRNEGAFHEKVTNRILDDIVAAIEPRFVRIRARWYVRGGIYTNVVAEHRAKGWKPADRCACRRCRSTARRTEAGAPRGRISASAASIASRLFFIGPTTACCSQDLVVVEVLHQLVVLDEVPKRRERVLAGRRVGLLLGILGLDRQVELVVEAGLQLDLKLPSFLSASATALLRASLEGLVDPSKAR